MMLLQSLEDAAFWCVWVGVVLLGFWATRRLCDWAQRSDWRSDHWD